VHQFTFAAGQAVADLAQRIGVRQLTEHHGHELRPASEAFCVSLGLTLLDQRGEFGSGKVLQKLIEQTGNQYQGNALLERVMEPTRVFDSLTTMTGGHVPPQPAGGVAGAGRRPCWTGRGECVAQ